MKTGIVLCSLFIIVALCATSAMAVECGTTLTSGCIVTTNTNLSMGTYYPNVSSGFSFTINASNIVFDGNGSTIYYANNAAGIGLYVNNVTNVTLKNFKIYQGNNTFSNYSAIRIWNSTYINISNITVETSGNISSAIFESYTNNTNIYGSTVRTNISNDSIGIYCDTLCSNNSVYDNNITTYGNSSYAIHFQVLGNYNKFYNNFINTTGYGGIGIFMELHLTYANITNNTVYVYGNRSDGIRLDTNISMSTVDRNNIYVWSQTNGNGIYLLSDPVHPSKLTDATQNNTISNNLIYTYNTSDVGIWMINNRTQFNNVTGNNITTLGASAYGLYLYNITANNNFVNNIINTSGSSANGIFLAIEATNNSFSSNYVYTYGSSARGMRLENKVSYNNFSNMVVNTSSNSNGQGIYILSNSINNIFNNVSIISSTHAMYFGTGAQNATVLNSNLSCVGASCYSILFDTTYTGGGINISNTNLSNLQIYQYAKLDNLSLNGLYFSGANQSNINYTSTRIYMKNANTTASKNYSLFNANPVLITYTNNTPILANVADSLNYAFVLNQNADSYIYKNFALSETPRAYSPIGLTYSSTDLKQIQSNLTDTISNVTTTVYVSKCAINNLTYRTPSSYTETYLQNTAAYTESNFTCNATTSEVTFVLHQIEPGINVLNVGYDRTGESSCITGYALVTLFLIAIIVVIAALIGGEITLSAIVSTVFLVIVLGIAMAITNSLMPVVCG